MEKGFSVLIHSQSSIIEYEGTNINLHHLLFLKQHYSRFGIELAMINILNPRTYLDTLFLELDKVNKSLLRAYTNIYSIATGHSLLEFGGGPSIFSLISAAAKVDSIHFTDYSDECLLEIKKWHLKQPNSFKWDKFIKYTIWYENGFKLIPHPEIINQRQDLLRNRIKIISRCDAFAPDPLLGTSLKYYDIVANNFCLDAIGQDKAIFEMQIRKLVDLISARGWYINASLLNGKYWELDGTFFPAVYLKEEDIKSIFEASNLRIVYNETIMVKGRGGYDGFIIMCGQKG
jgi:hypothetical protein